MKHLARCVILVVLAVCAMPAVTALEPAEIEDLYRDATQLFREAATMADTDPEAARERFRKAALRFESIARDGGIRNGKLYYNIGNCHFRLEDLGRAILYYRRAERYIPNDLNLRQNLAYARSRRLDRVEPSERTRVLRTVLFFHYDLSQRVRAALFVGAGLAMWTALAVGLAARRRLPLWLGLAAGTLAAAMLASLAVERQVQHTRREGVVISREAVARKGDAASYEPAFTEPLHAGTEFRILQDRGDWVEVALEDGRTCWLPAKDVEAVH